MADNVKWISDHAGGAKIILWAHNGHISHSKFGGIDHPMGEYLRKAFKGDFLNFGFAFNKGSFRAVGMSGGLREFTVSRLPEGSLDRTLGLVGEPAFAIDLRQLPAQGKVAEWFSVPRMSRSIGALYSESDPNTYRIDIRPQDAYDVMLFVDDTTAARGNR